jgi:hypothetical protein
LFAYTTAGGKLQKVKVILVYFDGDVGGAENMADISNAKFLTSTPNWFFTVF